MSLLEQYIRFSSENGGYDTSSDLLRKQYMTKENVGEKKSRMEILLESQEVPSRSKILMQQCGERIGMSKGVIEELINPQQIIILRLPVKFFGKVIIFWGCISLHNNARGPYKGGIRIASDVTIWETVELSRLMTLKTAISDIEFGGGKTGIRINMPDIYKYFKKAEQDLEFEKVLKLDVCEELAYQSKRYLMDLTYIPAPDMGTGPEEMAIIYNQTLNPATVTGKPDGIQGWLPGRREATGFGCCYTTIRFIKEVLNLDPSKSTVAIQGFGNVGSHLAIFLAEKGVKIIGITDIYGGCYDNEGLDIPALVKYVQEKRTIKGFTNANITNEKLFALDVDVLIPSACGHVLTKENAQTVKAKGIVEAANAPITMEAMKIFKEKDIKIIPDIIANAGGVIASMEEYSRSLSAIKIQKSDVFRIIEDKIGKSLDFVFEKSKKEKIDFTSAAIQIAMERVYNAMRIRHHIV